MITRQVISTLLLVSVLLVGCSRKQPGTERHSSEENSQYSTSDGYTEPAGESSIGTHTNSQTVTKTTISDANSSGSEISSVNGTVPADPIQWDYPGEVRASMALQTLEFQGVSLDGGKMKTQLDEVKQYYLSVSNDDLLKGFRLRAGKSAPGKDLGGWYSADVFNPFGQILSGIARLYASTGDFVCLLKLQYLIEEWASCIDANGYFFYSDNPNERYYFYDKMVCGLLDAYEYAGVDNALVYLDTITDWAEKHLKRDNLPNYGVGGSGTSEWYTLSENLYRAYLFTGNTRYRQFGKVWEYNTYWDTLASGKDMMDVNGWYHAYSHVNTLSGAAMAHIVYGSGNYLKTITNAYSYFADNQLYATGGYGPDESFLTADARTGIGASETLMSTTNHFETQCGSWSIFKLSRYLMTITGKAFYGDWIEKVFWNGIGASIPMSSDGKTQYYSDYNLAGAAKTNNVDAWTCCTGTRIQAVAEHANLVYFQNNRDIYVNLFTDSTASYQIQDKKVKVVQRTTFPQSNTSTFTMTLNQPLEYAMRIRSPEWLASPMTVAVNGQTVKAVKDSNGWVFVQRIWKNGDVMQITLPMKWAVQTFSKGSHQQWPAAITYGPLVMCVASPGYNPVGKIDFSQIAKNFTPIPGKPLQFQMKSDSSITLKPYYMFKENEKYFMYFDPSYAYNSISHTMLTYSGSWWQNDGMHFSDSRGASVEWTFTGTAVRLLYDRFDDAGKANVMIDGKLVEVIDMYHPSRNVRSVAKYENLGYGKHTVRIVNTATKRNESKGYYINMKSIAYSIS